MLAQGAPRIVKKAPRGLRSTPTRGPEGPPKIQRTARGHRGPPTTGPPRPPSSCLRLARAARRRPRGPLRSEGRQAPP
eukprot:5799321-Pyramimonas_sp.AAC.1